MISVAGQCPHHTGGQCQRLPTEDRTVERLGALGVPGSQAVEVQRAMLVHDPRSPVVLCLPDAERGSFEIRENRHPPRIHDVEGLDDDGAAGIASLGRRLISAGNPDVGVPHRRRGGTVRDRSNRSHVPATQTADEVLALRPFGHHVLELPAEHGAIKREGGFRVGLGGVDPARHTGDVAVSLGHDRRLSVRFVLANPTRRNRTSHGRFRSSCSDLLTSAQLRAPLPSRRQEWHGQLCRTHGGSYRAW